MPCWPANIDQCVPMSARLGKLLTKVGRHLAEFGSPANEIEINLKH